MLEINIPDVVAEVTEAFERYERALVANDVAALDALFWKSPEYAALRHRRESLRLRGDRGVPQLPPPIDLTRHLKNTVIVSYGRDFATANTEFQRVGSTVTGRQSHVWVRTEDGWRIAAAHVSLMPATARDTCIATSHTCVGANEASVLRRFNGGERAPAVPRSWKFHIRAQGPGSVPPRHSRKTPSSTAFRWLARIKCRSRCRRPSSFFRYAIPIAGQHVIGDQRRIGLFGQPGCVGQRQIHERTEARFVERPVDRGAPLVTDDDAFCAAAAARAAFRGAGKGLQERRSLILINSPIGFDRSHATPRVALQSFVQDNRNVSCSGEPLRMVPAEGRHGRYRPARSRECALDAVNDGRAGIEQRAVVIEMTTLMRSSETARGGQCPAMCLPMVERSVSPTGA